MRRNPFFRRNADDVIADLLRETVARAMKMPPGVERERLLRMAEHHEIQANLTAWANSPGLQRPV